jgi:hypothetical protein
MGIIDKTQRPSREHILRLWRVRNSQRTIKIRPYSERPVLLGEVPQVNTIGVGQGGGRRHVRLAGGDLPVGATSETDWYYPTSKAFSENAATAGNAGEEAPAANANSFTPQVDEDRDPDRCGF